MSIDSNDIDSTSKESSSSDSAYSNRSNTFSQGKTSSARQFDIEDDEDDIDEFKAMFMSKAYTSKTRPNYASTPLIRSQHHNQYVYYSISKQSSTK
jgi:hypothetical protein